MKRAIIPTFVISLILFSVIVSATTASIGNAKMILSLSPRETVERSILVRNVNDVPVTITLTPEGDLKDDIELEETEFVLSPREEKKAYFTIRAQNTGTTNSQINVLFTPEDGNVVGLVSKIIVIVDGSDSDSGNENTTENDNSKDNNEIITNSSDDGAGFSFNINNNKNKVPGTNSPLKMSPILMLSLSTIILAIILIVLFIYASKNPGKSGSIKPKKSAAKSEV